MANLEAPHTPENSARDETIPTFPPERRGRGRNIQAETSQAPAVEFPSLEDGKRITYQMIGSLINSLRITIGQQTSTIQAARAEIREIKTEQQALKDQNTKLQEEVQALREQIKAQTVNPTPRTWAEVTAGNNSQNTVITAPRPQKELNCVRISTARPTDEIDFENDNDNNRFTRFLPTDAANNHIRTALSNAEPTKDVQVAGVGTTKTGYVIRFRDAQSAEKARNNTSWLEELGNETKLVKPRFGVVVHRVPTEDFALDREKKEGIEKIMEENDLAEKGFEIEDIAWLKKKDRPLGRSASMGIWLNTPEAAESILNNGLLVGQRYIGSVEPYKVELKRCHRCQRFGHLAWSCKEQVKCGHCSGQHDQRHCLPGVRPRCSDCNGEHPTGDRRCQTPLNPSSSQ
jgi:FtsZ-binding cell division protein ZapB